MSPIPKSSAQEGTDSHQFVVNGRYLRQPITGVQRYAREIASRITTETILAVPSAGRGLAGHLWEQTLLPISCDGRLLWSPNASGPMFYKRQVVTFHDIFPIEHPEWYSRNYARWYGIAMRRLAAKALHLIAVSEYTKSRIVEVLGRSAEDVSVIHNGCHVKGRADSGSIQAAHRALDLPARYVLSLSSLEKRKNLTSILQAWSMLYPQLPEDLWLVLAGPPANTGIFSDQTNYKALPRVRFTGYVPEEHLHGLYSGALLFVFPSLAEGFGLPLLEAMSCGVRCITSNTSSLPEIGGDAVEYVDPNNPSELTRTIARLLPQCNNSIYQPSIDRSSMFTWDTAASKTLAVLHALSALGTVRSGRELSLQRSMPR